MLSEKTFIPSLKLLVAIFTWAALYHIAKFIIVPGLSVYLMAFIRYFIAGFCLWGVLRFKTGRFIHPLTLKQGILIFFIGLVGIFTYNVMFFYAESLISGNLVAILYAFTPCITCILSSIVFKVKLRWQQKFGILIALIGAIGVITYATDSSWSSFVSWNPGILFAILAAVSFAVYSVLNKCVLNQNLSGIVINTYAAIVGAVILFAASLLHGDSLTIISSFNFRFWLAMFYVSIIATVIAYLWYTSAIAKIGILRTVIFQNTLPLQTILVGFVIFNEKINSGVLYCGLIILCGVYIINRNPT